MIDSAPKRAAMIVHLESALGIARELSEPVIGYLIERTLDEARAGQSFDGPAPARLISASRTRRCAQRSRPSSRSQSQQRDQNGDMFSTSLPGRGE